MQGYENKTINRMKKQQGDSMREENRIKNRKDLNKKEASSWSA